MDIVALTQQFQVWATDLISSMGYVGLFLVNFIASASIIFPIPAFLLVFGAGSLRILNPWIIGIAAGAGAALGELIGYGIGKGGREVVKEKYKKLIKTGEKWIENHSSFLMIVVFAATPLPDDILGIVCGVFDYDIKKFFLASFIGKVIMNSALAWGGFYGFQWVSEIFGSTTAGLLIGICVVAVMLYYFLSPRIKKRK